MWMCHGSRLNVSWHICEWVMAHIWMRQGTPLNESRHTCERIMACIWTRSWHRSKWVMVHMWIGHGAHPNESWCTYEWVIACNWTSHGTHLNALWHTCEWVMAQNKSWKLCHRKMTSHVEMGVHICRNECIHVWHDSFLCVTWLIIYTHMWKWMNREQFLKSIHAKKTKKKRIYTWPESSIRDMTHRYLKWLIQT